MVTDSDEPWRSRRNVLHPTASVRGFRGPHTLPNPLVVGAFGLSLPVGGCEVLAPWGVACASRMADRVEHRVLFIGHLNVVVDEIYIHGLCPLKNDWAVCALMAAH